VPSGTNIPCGSSQSVGGHSVCVGGWVCVCVCDMSGVETFELYIYNIIPTTYMILGANIHRWRKYPYGLYSDGREASSVVVYNYVRRVTVCCAISTTHTNSMELYVAMVLTNNIHEFGWNHPHGLQECTYMRVLLSE
jgi:hypothetical protein